MMNCEHKAIAVVFISLTLFGLFFSMTHAVKEDIGDLGNGPDATLTADQPQVDTLKRIPGFVRIGRQGNFIRIGRPSSFVRIGKPSSFVRIGRPSSFVRIGKDSDTSYGQSGHSNDNNYKMRDDHTASVLKAMRWYPHLHRFIRIGRHNVNTETSNDVKMSPEFGLTRDSEMINSGEKRSNFGRFGRSISILSGRLGSSDNEAYKDDTKRMHAFVRVGKGLVDSSDELEQPVLSGQRVVGDKRQSAFVRIGKSPETYLDSYVDVNSDGDGHVAYQDTFKPSKKSSSFVRIGKSHVKAMGNNFMNIYTHMVEKPLIEERVPTFDSTENEGYEIDIEKDREGGSSGMYEGSTSVTSSDEDGHSAERRASSFVRIGKQAEKRDSEARQLLTNSIDLSTPQSSMDGGQDHFKEQKRSHSSYYRRGNPFEKISANADKVINSDRPIEATSRRSAFVRIGKIPSSAFVRIGKNYDRMLQMPFERRPHHRHYLRGHSSFVRIG